ncbi:MULTISPECIES: metallophosphoesterase family protein [Prochlorococcus]|nr:MULTISPECIES: metallophosphoesterase family protein [Prochlorococcus]KGG35555.1 putative calcineurin family phosphoesterase [Prochlorococcus sp. SS52]
MQSCNIKKTTRVPKGSTVVIGHAYGNQSSSNHYISKKLESFLDKNIDNINQIILTGDVFSIPTKRKWAKLYQNYNIKADLIISPGNHDVGFNNKYLRDIFYNASILNRKIPYRINSSGFDLIVEDSTISNWIINKSTIDLINSSSKNNSTILLRHHIPIQELVILANSMEGYKGDLPTATQLSKSIKVPITIISGDGGAFFNQPRLMCKKYNNITFIVNGIGNFDNDKIIILYKNRIYKYNLK